LTGPNKVLLVLGRRSSAHHEDRGFNFKLYGRSITGINVGVIIKKKSVYK